MSGGAKHLLEWARSPEFRAIARRQALANLAEINSRPRCGAACRGDGRPCQQPAMANGRCRRHGGKTPKGDEWHRPQWPKADAPDAISKMNRKVVNLQKRKRKQDRRRESMTPEELQEHKRWQADHKPGPAGPRAMRRKEISDTKAVFGRGRHRDAGQDAAAIAPGANHEDIFE